jgi:hypothetical protein
LATPDYLNDFTKAALYIASTLNVTLINTNQKRNISNVNTKGKGKGGGKKLTRSYSPVEWRALSNEERKKVLDARAKAKSDHANKSNNTGAGGNPINKGTTAAVNTQENSSGSEEGELLVHAGNVAEVLRQKKKTVPHQQMLVIICLVEGKKQQGLICYPPGGPTQVSNQGA